MKQRGDLEVSRKTNQNKDCKGFTTPKSCISNTQTEIQSEFKPTKNGHDSKKVKFSDTPTILKENGETIAPSLSKDYVVVSVPLETSFDKSIDDSTLNVYHNQDQPAASLPSSNSSLKTSLDTSTGLEEHSYDSSFNSAYDFATENASTKVRAPINVDRKQSTPVATSVFKDFFTPFASFYPTFGQSNSTSANPRINSGSNLTLKSNSTLINSGSDLNLKYSSIFNNDPTLKSNSTLINTGSDLNLKHSSTLNKDSTLEHNSTMNKYSAMDDNSTLDDFNRNVNNAPLVSPALSTDNSALTYPSLVEEVLVRSEDKATNVGDKEIYTTRYNRTILKPVSYKDLTTSKKTLQN